MKPSEYAKAITGAALAGLTALGAALADGEGVTGGEWVAIAVAVVATFGGVFGVPNTRPYRPPSIRREGGHFDLGTAGTILALVLIVLLIVWLATEIIPRV